jgi:hypothetical protein
LAGRAALGSDARAGVERYGVSIAEEVVMTRIHGFMAAAWFAAVGLAAPGCPGAAAALKYVIPYPDDKRDALS